MEEVSAVFFVRRSEVAKGEGDSHQKRHALLLLLLLVLLLVLSLVMLLVVVCWNRNNECGGCRVVHQGEQA